MKRLKHRLKTYSVLGDFILGVDHAAVCEGQSTEQMLFPLFPPLLVHLGDEKGWDPAQYIDV